MLFDNFIMYMSDICEKSNWLAWEFFNPELDWFQSNDNIDEESGKYLTFSIMTVILFVWEDVC